MFWCFSVRWTRRDSSDVLKELPDKVAVKTIEIRLVCFFRSLFGVVTGLINFLHISVEQKVPEERD